MRLASGFELVLERWTSGGYLLKEHQRVNACAIDVRCNNASGGNLTGAAAGSDAVILKLSAYDRLRIPKVTLPAASASPSEAIVGIVRWDQGVVADGEDFWLRVFGEHPYARVDGSTDVAAGNYLTSHALSAGAFEKTTARGDGIALALAGRTTNSVGALAVLLGDPGGLIRT